MLEFLLKKIKILFKNTKKEVKIISAVLLLDNARLKLEINLIASFP